MTAAELLEHRRQVHDPRDPEAEPCCFECCDCATDSSEDEDDD